MVESVIVSDPDVMNGTPCFRGTRVPFMNFIDRLEGGHALGSSSIGSRRSRARWPLGRLRKRGISGCENCMKVLLDECLPLEFRHELRRHVAHTVQRAGFKGMKNGELL